MQSTEANRKRMDTKSAEVFRDPGAKAILTHLVNVPSRERDFMRLMEEGCDPETEARAREFIENYGALRFSEGSPESLTGVAIVAALFRQAWTAGEDERRIQGVNQALELIIADRKLSLSPQTDAFRAKSPGPLEVPVYRANFRTGEWTPKARDLADALAMELMHSRRMLHICERPDCGRYFVKEFSRDRYCSIPCSEEMRRVGQRTWAKGSRAKSSSKSSAKRKTRKKRK